MIPTNSLNVASVEKQQQQKQLYNSVFSDILQRYQGYHLLHHIEIESITIPLSRCSSNDEIPLSCSTLKAAQLIFVAGPLPLTKGEGTSRKHV